MTLLEEMATKGISCKVPIVDDGQIHRFINAERNKKDLSAWYVSYGDVVFYGDWALGVSKRWVRGRYDYNESQIKNVWAIKKSAEYTLRQSHELNAKKAYNLWQSLGLVGTSAYLKRKQINASGVKFDSKSFYIPLFDIEGKLWNLQRIFDSGIKRFLPGRKKACFFVITTSKNSESIYVCEGFSTGCSIHMATKKAVLVAFDAGNIEPVIDAVKDRYPQISITIAADNDCHQGINVGLEKAALASSKHGCDVIYPKFPDHLKPKNLTDFNDMHVEFGLDYLKKYLIGESR